MKKLSIFGVVALLLLGLSATALAADIKVSGKWQIDFMWNNNQDFMAGTNGEDKTFDIQQRMRTAFTFIANENLKAVLDTQIGANNWGNGLYSIGAGRAAGAYTAGALSGGVGASATANSAGNGNIMLRQGYLDFKWPGTKVGFKVGFQTVSLPAAFGGGSAILDDQVAAAVVSAPINDNISILAGYARPLDSQSYGTQTTAGASGAGTSMDVVFAAVPLSFTGVSVVPFAAYANVGHQAYNTTTGGTGLGGLAGPNSTANMGMRAYWGGAAFTMTALDPFKVMADVNYGKATWNNTPAANNSNGGRSGWLADIAIDYTGLKMMTPELFFAYSSGEKGNSTEGKDSGRMPIMGNPQNWTIGSFYFGDRNFINGFSHAGTTSYDGYYRNVEGFWTVGLSLKDIKYIDKLSHTINLLYAKGTNNVDSIKESGYAAAMPNYGYGGTLTTKDSLWEFDLNTKYQLYDELTLNLDLGYVNANYDKNTWTAVGAPAYSSSSLSQSGVQNAYKAGFSMIYAF